VTLAPAAAAILEMIDPHAKRACCALMDALPED
jgi:hypothetical protein